MNCYLIRITDGKREWFTSRVDALVRLARLNHMFRNSQLWQLREVY